MKLTDKALRTLANHASPAWHRKNTATEDEASIVCNDAIDQLRAMATELAAEVLRRRKELRIAARLLNLSETGYPLREWARICKREP